MNALNSLMNPAQVGQQFTQAFQQGQQQRRETETRNALSAFAMNPADENAFNALAQNAPEYAIQVRQQRDKAQQQQQAQQLQQAAAQGDQGALAQLAGIDLDAWAKLDTRSKAAVKERTDFMGQAALAVSQLPPQQQAQAWDSYVQQGVQMGFDDLAQYQGRYSPDAVQALLANSGLVKQFLDTQRIDYKVIPQGGYLQGFDAMGRPLAEGGGQMQQAGAPQPGMVQDGYRFRGGNPADQNSWEPVGQNMSAGSPDRAISLDGYRRLEASMGRDQAAAYVRSQQIAVR